MAKAPKQIKFVCYAPGCPNEAIEYTWETNDITAAECGGCGATLEAIDA